MLRHLLIGPVEHRFRTGILDPPVLRLSGVRMRSDPAEIPVGVDMTGNPGLLLHVQKGLPCRRSRCMAAPLQTGRRQPLPGVCVHQRRRLAAQSTCMVLAGLVLQMHGGFRFVDIVCVVLVELGGFVGQFTVLTALLAVFHPQQAQGDAALLHLSVYPFVVWHLVLLAQCSGRVQLPGDLFRAAVLDLVPEKLLFCGPLKGCYDCAARTAATFRKRVLLIPRL